MPIFEDVGTVEQGWHVRLRLTGDDGVGGILGNTGDQRSKHGIIYGIVAYGSWGLFPLYFKSLADVAPVEVLAHRTLWCLVVLAVLVQMQSRWGELLSALRNRKLMFMLGMSTLLISSNWLIFIYAIVTGQVLEASQGYFINPLVNVLLGVVFLRERLRPYQSLSIALAAMGVLVLGVLVGQVPWIALTLAVTFSLYGLMKKILPMDGLLSLTAETLAMMPVALAYLGYLSVAAKAGGSDVGTMGLLMLSGPVTTVPLLFFSAAARRLRLSTMGILQYLEPSLQFLLAVLAFGEPFSSAQMISFTCIWAAIGIYTADSLRAQRQVRSGASRVVRRRAEMASGNCPYSL